MRGPAWHSSVRRSQCFRLPRPPEDAGARADLAFIFALRAKMNGRRERIRTSGPYVPNVVLYQAELLSVTMCERRAPRLGRRPYSHAPRPPQPGKNAALPAIWRGLRSAPAGLYGAALLGRRQAVRHRILIPACGGSIPPAPATSLPLPASLPVNLGRPTRWAAYGLCP